MKYLLALLLLASNAYADTFNLSWDAVTTDAQGDPVVGLTGYRLYVSNSPIKATWPPIASLAPQLIAAPATSATVTRTALGKYYAVVTAHNEGGESGPSNEIMFEVKVKPPSNPTNLKVAN